MPEEYVSDWGIKRLEERGIALEVGGAFTSFT
jgi:hypothetical protein